MAEPMSNKELKEILALFADLPQGRSARNHYLFNQIQARAIKRLRVKYTPKEMENVLDISVYRLRKLEVWAQSFDHGKQLDRSKGYKKRSKAYQWRPVEKPPVDGNLNVETSFNNAPNDTPNDMSDDASNNIHNDTPNDISAIQIDNVILDAQIDEIIFAVNNISISAGTGQ